MATELGRALDDDWTLLRGYRNRRGEIDQLLLGPRGLFAIEVKNLNATVTVDGDRWRADKYRALAAAVGLRMRKMVPTGHLSDGEVAFIRPRLDHSFLDVPVDVLSWTGFWMILEK